MTEVDSDAENANFSLFRDCVFNSLTERTTLQAKRSSKRERSRSQSERAPNQPDDASELVDFSDYLATEIFDNLPQEVRKLSYKTLENDSTLSDRWSLPLSLSTLEDLSESIPGSVEDSLTAYGLIQPPKSDVQSFISPIVAAYVAGATTPPPKWISTKVSACQICERDWVPLTYHHLIPRQTHAKVLKRGWHEEDQLNSVAWLCRACHTFVHKMASNEELALEWYTVEKICSREDVQKWAQWVGKIRWRKR